MFRAHRSRPSSLPARLLAALAAVLLLALLVPAAALGQQATDEGQVIVVVNGDVTVEEGDEAEVVVVVSGTATINGTVEVLVVVDADATITGAQIGTLTAAQSDVELGPGTVVRDDVIRFDANIAQDPDAEIGGEVRDGAADIAWLGFFFGLVGIALWIGFGLATLVAGLFVAGIAARQVRMAEAAISREPLLTALVGLVAIILPPVLAIMLMFTLVGAPLGFAILLVAWPAVAYAGYLVAAIWLGEWILSRTRGGPAPARPYLASVVGLLIVLLLGVVPLVTFVVSLFGLGAVVLTGWRVLTRPPAPPAPVAAAAAPNIQPTPPPPPAP